MSEAFQHIQHLVPVTYSKDEAVGLLEESGIVGCGGAGFPTYVKYVHPTPTLLVNAAESEPGYYANKLLLRDHAEEFAALFHYLRDAFNFKDIVIGAEDVARPYCRDLEALADETGYFRMEYVEPLYKYGQERALCERVLGVKVPKGKIPPDVGVIVNNNETLYDMYKALIEDRPVTTKFLQVYGEARPLRVYEVPIGTFATDLLQIHGTKLESVGHCKLYDGGPILAELVMERIDQGEPYAVHTTTNGLLVVDPAKDRPRNKYYPDPSYKHNTIDAPWAPTQVINVEDKVHRVRIPVNPRFCRAPHAIVKVGDRVAKEQTIAVPDPDGFSLGLSASIAGVVTHVNDEYVQIEQGDVEALGGRRLFPAP